MMTRYGAVIFLTWCVAAVAAAGDLWIVSEAGDEVFVDGRSVGVIESAGNGVRIPGLDAGEHTVKTSKDGVMSAEYGFKLGFAPTQVVIVEPGSLAVSGDNDGTANGVEVSASGVVEITSNPKTCTVLLGTRKYAKKQPIMLLVGMPVGEHDVRFESEEASLQSVVSVTASQTPAQVKVDFSSSRVAVVAVPSASVAAGSDDSVQVSRAGELFSQAAAPSGRSSSSGIATSAEAKALASHILQQFEESPGQALKAQAGDRVDQYAYLLQTAPL